MYAVLDLGSNSFHLVIADKNQNKTDIVKALSSKVQLAEGLTETGAISADAMQRALEAFEMFRSIMDEYTINHLCVVGTKTFREASNAAKLMERANALGFPINVISGQQEAFYIYQGIQAFLPRSNEPRLIFDIGGGSTEFAIGLGDAPQALDSLPIGCVTCRLSGQEKITRKSLAATRRHVHELLDAHLNSAFYELDWHEVFASSGTSKMLRNVLRENGIIKDAMITERALLDLEELALDLGTVDALSELKGFKSQ